VQGDEPLIPPAIISQVANNLANTAAPMATLAVSIDDEHEIFNPNAVKVVMDKQGHALYFSRATIPWDRDGFAQQPKQWQHIFLRHIGIYAYRAGFIRKYVSWPASPLEQIESLEQLRVLWHGEKIHIAVAVENPPAGVDTAEDLEKVRYYLDNAR
jgi:3-deoxy-manno-octulosonate cytidylyltransferase (CMP-KDO synthetase)